VPLSTIVSLILHIISSRQARGDKKEILGSIDKVIDAIKKSEVSLKQDIGYLNPKPKIVELYNNFFHEYVKFLKEVKVEFENEPSIREKLSQDLKIFLRYLETEATKGKRDLTKDEEKQFKQLLKAILEVEKVSYSKEEMFFEIHQKLYCFAEFISVGRPYINILMNGTIKRLKARKESIIKLENSIEQIK